MAFPVWLDIQSDGGMKPWTPEETAEAKKQWLRGESAKEIGEGMERTRGSVYRHMFRLGLARPPALIATTAKAQNKVSSPGFNTRFGPQKPQNARKANPAAWLPLPGSSPKGLLEAPPNGCRWPIGDDPILACCERRAPGDKAYCAAHRLISIGGA